MERGKQWEGKGKRKWERGKEGVGVKGRKGKGQGRKGNVGCSPRTKNYHYTTAKNNQNVSVFVLRQLCC